MHLRDSGIRLYPARYIRAVLRHMGPEFWIVSIFPFYISWVWASGEIFPSYNWLAETPTYAGQYLDHVGEWFRRSWDFVLGLIIVGPLLGGGTVLYDDYFDRGIDPENPRKSSLPFYKWPTESRVIGASALALFLISLELSVLISPQFFAVAACIVALSVVYSTPPLRFKARGGLDLATNMVGFGVLCSLAGYVIAGPLPGYPWLWLVVMVFGTGSLYVLTTIADMEADGRTGVRSVAVKLGLGNAIKLSMALLLVANVTVILLGLSGYLYTPGVVLRVWPISVLEFVPLLHLLRYRDTGSVLKVIFSTGSLMAFGTFLLALNHVGIWDV